MISSWHRDEDDETPTSREVQAMATVLEARHGMHAALVAEFFSDLHGQKGDIPRSWAWAGVANAVRRREWARVQAA
jgi:hypothetical protein